MEKYTFFWKYRGTVEKTPDKSMKSFFFPLCRISGRCIWNNSLAPGGKWWSVVKKSLPLPKKYVFSAFYGENKAKMVNKGVRIWEAIISSWFKPYNPLQSLYPGYITCKLMEKVSYSIAELIYYVTELKNAEK